MGDERDGAIGYLSTLVSGLVASAVGAAMLHADFAAAILATVMLLVLAAMCLWLRGRAL